MKRAANKPTHVTHGNVLDDLGFSPEDATALKFKAELYQAILKYAKKYSQQQLQIILGEPQPRVSELLNGKIANKSVDKLLRYAGRLGIEAKAKFAQTHKELLRRSLYWPINADQTLPLFLFDGDTMARDTSGTEESASWVDQSNSKQKMYCWY